eukprot:984640-Pelagomonas_calceolata.AAC.1
MSYCVWPGSCVHACENRGAGRSALQAGWLERGVLQRTIEWSGKGEKDAKAASRTLYSAAK